MNKRSPFLTLLVINALKQNCYFIYNYWLVLLKPWFINLICPRSICFRHHRQCRIHYPATAV
jgi:hypothetical protein